MNDKSKKIEGTIEHTDGLPGPGIQLPFRVCSRRSDGNGVEIYRVESDGGPVCFIPVAGEEGKALAEFIAEACNDHDRLRRSATWPARD